MADVPAAAFRVRYIQWGPIVAGALVAAASASVLHAFAAAIGLAVSSTAPTWRDASFALVLLSGLYLVLVAIAAYGVGGYVAGRMREGLAGAGHGADEIEFRDGVHGLAVWALASVLTALVALASVSAISRLSAPSAGASGPAASVGSENIIAYDLDRLLRSDRTPENIEYARAEAGRILLTASSHDGVRADDRTYLIAMVSARTGLAEPDATRRVDAAIASAQDNIGRARTSAVLMAFMAGAAALLGAAVAWFAAGAGGHHRDAGLSPTWFWPGRPAKSA